MESTPKIKRLQFYASRYVIYFIYAFSKKVLVTQTAKCKTDKVEKQIEKSAFGVYNKRK